MWRTRWARRAIRSALRKDGSWTRATRVTRAYDQLVTEIMIAKVIHIRWASEKTVGISPKPMVVAVYAMTYMAWNSDIGSVGLPSASTPGIRARPNTQIAKTEMTRISGARIRRRTRKKTLLMGRPLPGQRRSMTDSLIIRTTEMLLATRAPADSETTVAIWWGESGSAASTWE